MADVANLALNALGDRSFRSSIGCVSRPGAQPLHILIYSSTARTQLMDGGGFDLVILDGEAAPVGGMGIAKQLKDEIEDCPPVLVLTGRADDAWLASWSRAEAAVPHPIDPIRLGEAVVGLLRAPVQ